MSDYVPAFGLTGKQIAVYADNFIQDIMDGLTDTGDYEHGKQGYQDWEAEGIADTIAQAQDYIKGTVTELVRMSLLLERHSAALETATVAATELPGSVEI